VLKIISNMRQLRFVRLALLSAFAITPLGAWADEPLNVVLIVADDLGWTDLACYGSDLHETPHLDRLAAQSLRFTDAYASAAICSPTRAALLTGKSPARLGMTIWHEWAARGPERVGNLLAAESEANLARSEQTLAEVLRAAGYATCHIGKWHVGDPLHYPETQGFDVNIGGTLWGAPATFFWPYRGPFDSELRYVPGLIGGEKDEYLTDRLTSEALSLIETHRDRPFYLNLWYHTVHTPIEGKPDVVRRYEPGAATAKRHRHATYAAMVHSLDENVGRVLAKLDELKLSERTLVIFTSDNGGVVHKTRWGVVTTNEPLRSGKGSLYEGGIRVPLMVRLPGVTKPNGVCLEPVISHDLFPTIVEAVGAARHVKNDGIEGLSLASLLKDPDARLERTQLFWHYPHFYPTTKPVSAIREGKYKLVHFYDDGRDELYDLSSDIGEQKNIAASQPDRSTTLRHDLDGWLKKVDARLPRHVNGNP